MAALSQRVSRATLVGMLVQPETVLGWHRELVRRRWAAFRRRRGPRRPCLDPELQKLILQMAKDNPIWGCVRVRGELLKLGHRVSATANSHVAAPGPDRAGAIEIKAYVEDVPTNTGVGDRVHRFPQRRHCATERLYVLIYMYVAGDSAGDLVRCDRPARR